MTPSFPEQKSKKVLFIITKSYFGGAQRYVFELARGLKEKGYDVAVACGGDGPLVEMLELINIHVYLIHSFQRDLSILKDLHALKELSECINEFKPDVVHVNSSKAGGLGSLIARLLGVPKIIFTAHGWPFLEPRSLLWRSMAWSGSYLTGALAHRIILVSHHDLKNTNMPGIKSKCVVIHTAVETFPLLSREEARTALLNPLIVKAHLNDTWVVTHGELNHNKNHLTALRAIAKFNQTNDRKIFYTIIGAGETQPLLESEISKLGLGTQVYFTGHKTEARKYLKAFDIYLISSLKEGLPYSLLEAAVAKLTCLASRVGGIPEVVTDKVSGLLFDPKDEGAILDTLKNMNNESNKAKEYADNLSQQVVNDFNLNQMIAQTENIYRMD